MAAMGKNAAKYAWLTVRHKLLVLQAGIKIGVPIKLLISHDMSKFSHVELPHYGRQFCGDKGDPMGFAAAWLHHQNVNPHHWEYWIRRGGKDDGKPLPMPERYALEMLADWAGAGKAYAGSWAISTWVAKNLCKMLLHSRTIEVIWHPLLDYVRRTEGGNKAEELADELKWALKVARAREGTA